MLRTLSLAVSLLLLANVKASPVLEMNLFAEADDNSTLNKSMYFNDTFTSGYINIDE